MMRRLLMGVAASLAAAPALAQAGGAAPPGSIASTTVFPDPATVPGSIYAPAGSPPSSIGGQINMTLAMGAVPPQSASPKVSAPPDFMGLQTAPQAADSALPRPMKRRR